MAGALKTSTKVMGAMNAQLDAAGVAQTMQQFAQASMAMDMKQEIMDDTLDGIMDGDSDMEGEVDDITQGVLDEIGIDLAGKMASVPSAARGKTAAAKQREEEEEAADPETEDLMKRVAALK